MLQNSSAVPMDRAAAMDSAVPLANDLLEGAGAIGKFLYGRSDHRARRKVYRLVSEVAPEKRLPIFRLGDIICARKSILLKYIASQEESKAS
jgi:hypothetical protein